MLFLHIKINMKNVTDDIGNAVQMLNKYADESSIKPLISILEKLK